MDGLPAFLSIFPKYGPVYFIGMGIAFAGPLILIPIMYLIPKVRRDIRDTDSGKGAIKFDMDALMGKSPSTKKEIKKDVEEVKEVEIPNSERLIAENKGAKEIIFAPIKGNLIKLDDSCDETFASKVLGEGIAIEPEDSVIVSPADGIVSMIFKTNHAISVTTNKGVEVLIHVGVDTVAMNGRGFKSFVSVGDKVKLGDKLLEVDFNLVKKEAVADTVFMVIANTDKFKDIIPMSGGQIKEKDAVINIDFN